MVVVVAAELRQGFAKRKPKEEMEQQGKEAARVGWSSPLVPPTLYIEGETWRRGVLFT